MQHNWSISNKCILLPHGKKIFTQTLLRPLALQGFLLAIYSNFRKCNYNGKNCNANGKRQRQPGH